MCEWGNKVQIWMPTKRAFGEYVDVDRCIAHLVVVFNSAGFETISSCCGHGKRPGSISFRNGTEILLMSVEEARKLDHLWPPINPVEDNE